VNHYNASKSPASESCSEPWGYAGTEAHSGRRPSNHESARNVRLDVHDRQLDADVRQLAHLALEPEEGEWRAQRLTLVRERGEEA